MSITDPSAQVWVAGGGGGGGGGGGASTTGGGGAALAPPKLKIRLASRLCERNLPVSAKAEVEVVPDTGSMKTAPFEKCRRAVWK